MNEMELPPDLDINTLLSQIVIGAVWVLTDEEARKVKAAGRADVIVTQTRHEGYKLAWLPQAKIRRADREEHDGEERGGFRDRADAGAEEDIAEDLRPGVKTRYH